MKMRGQSRRLMVWVRMDRNGSILWVMRMVVILARCLPRLSMMIF